MNGGSNVGPFTGRGVIRTMGNITDEPSMKTDPMGSSRTTLVDPTGSFTTLNTGGTPGKFHMNPVTCAFRFNIKGIDARIVDGTGAYVNATGDFRVNLHLEGYLSRTATGCDTNQADPSAFETDTGLAVGHINLGPPMVTPHT